MRKIHGNSSQRVAFGVAGAGMAFALQKVIVSLAGWVAMSFGRVINTPITQVVESQDTNKTGTGSVRRIKAFHANQP